jgi:hypothetical protein
MEQIGEIFKKIEQFLTNTMKNLLVMVNEQHQQKIMALVSAGTKIIFYYYIQYVTRFF